MFPSSAGSRSRRHACALFRRENVTCNVYFIIKLVVVSGHQAEHANHLCDIMRNPSLLRELVLCSGAILSGEIEVQLFCVDENMAQDRWVPPGSPRQRFGSKTAALHGWLSMWSFPLFDFQKEASR